MFVVAEEVSRADVSILREHGAKRLQSIQVGGGRDSVHGVQPEGQADAGDCEP